MEVTHEQRQKRPWTRQRHMHRPVELEEHMARVVDTIAA